MGLLLATTLGRQAQSHKNKSPNIWNITISADPDSADPSKPPNNYTHKRAHKTNRHVSSKTNTQDMSLVRTGQTYQKWKKTGIKNINNKIYFALLALLVHLQFWIKKTTNSASRLNTKNKFFGSNGDEFGILGQTVGKHLSHERYFELNWHGYKKIYMYEYVYIGAWLCKKA
jgi:hypothetical protein